MRITRAAPTAPRSANAAPIELRAKASAESRTGSGRIADTGHHHRPCLDSDRCPRGPNACDLQLARPNRCMRPTANELVKDGSFTGWATGRGHLPLSKDFAIPCRTHRVNETWHNLGDARGRAAPTPSCHTRNDARDRKDTSIGTVVTEPQPRPALAVITCPSLIFRVRRLRAFPPPKSPHRNRMPRLFDMNRPRVGWRRERC